MTSESNNKRGAPVESAVERIRTLNERIVAAAKQGGTESLKTYERMLENLAEAQEAAGERGGDWIREFGRAQAAFTRQLADAFPALLQRIGARGRDDKTDEKTEAKSPGARAPEQKAPAKAPEKKPPEKPAEPAGRKRAAPRGGDGATGEGELPIQGYDALTVRDILQRLPRLSPAELSKLDAYEAHTKNRKTVRDRIRSLRR